MENEGDKLWIPQDSRAIKDERYVEDHFDAGLRGGSVLFVPTSAANRDLINLDVFDRIWDIHEDIVKKVKGDGKNFEDLCAIKDNDNECFVVGPVQFFSGDRDYYDSVVQNRDDLAAALSATTYPDGSEVNRNQIFGDYKVDSSNQITSIKAAVQYYNVEGNPLSRALEWELNYIDELSGESGSDELDVYYYANRSLDDELGASVTGDILLLVITYVLMFTITGIVLAKRYDSFVYLRTGLSIAGIVIVLLSMLAGYGVCAGLGVPFNSLHQVLPFIIIGIGVDDMFIIIAAFDAQDDDLDTAERMARGLRRCGLSILYTTMTDVVAFYLGAASALPAITAFCLYAATTLLFNFCFQVLHTFSCTTFELI